MQTRNLFTLILALAGVGCTAEIGFDEPISPTPSQPHEVSLCVAHAPLSRTVLGDGDGSTQEIRWVHGDRLALWAQQEGAADYTLSGVPFTMATFNDLYSSADFRATIEQMEEGTYAYYALSPQPHAVSGTQVSYTLPATQSGSYQSNLNVMVAKGTGNALHQRPTDETLIEWQEPMLSFSNLFHLIRIRIPSGKNLLGVPIQRIEITFPQEVVGTASFDVTTPDQISWSNLSNKITVEMPLDRMADEEQNYIWLHVRPTTLNGTITFQAYDEIGVMAGEISTSVNKELTPQHITPIALTIPASPLGELTYIDINELGSNLGEDWQTMTLTGFNFVVPYTHTTTTTHIFTPNATKHYKVAVVASPSSMSGVTLPLQYESVHTLFSDPVTLPSCRAGEYAVVQKVVPYLLEEDFSGITSSWENGTVHKTSDAGEYDAISLAGYGLNDWYGARIGGAVGQNIRICSRMEMGMWVTNKNTARVDTPVLSKLKANANATIRVAYDYAGDRYEAVGDGGYPVYSAGVSNSVVTAGDDKIETVIVGDVVLSIDGPNADGTYYGVTPHHNSFDAPGCSSTTRVCWYLTNNRASGFAGNGMYWMYLDNIKVQIAQ